MYKLGLVLIYSYMFVCVAVNVHAVEDIPYDVQEIIKAMNRSQTPQAKPENVKTNNSNKKVSKKSKQDSEAKFSLAVKVISCQKDKMPEFLASVAGKHDACGDLDSQIIFDKTFDVVLAQQTAMNNLKPVKLVRTVPEITQDGTNYVIKDKQILNTAKMGVEVFAKPTKIVDKKVQLDLAIRTTELSDNEEIFLDSNDTSFINSGINYKHRFLVASYPIALNQIEILGGNSAILTNKTSQLRSGNIYPEEARLWLEVKLMPPSK